MLFKQKRHGTATIKTPRTPDCCRRQRALLPLMLLLCRQSGNRRRTSPRGRDIVCCIDELIAGRSDAISMQCAAHGSTSRFIEKVGLFCPTFSLPKTPKKRVPRKSLFFLASDA